MHCPTCGAEVVEQSVYCHKCGGRLDLAEQDSPSAEYEEAVPASSPIEKFKDAATAAQQSNDEPERQLWQGGYSSKAMIGTWTYSGLLTLVLLAIWIWRVRNTTAWIVLLVLLMLLWLYQLLKLAYRRMNVRYRLTTQQFVHETGILRRVTDRIETIDMDDITFEQGVLERLVGVGTIRISSSDRTHPELMLLGIENVREVARMIDETRRAERRRRGLHIESI